ncbi:MAG: NIPSNAP family containing protein [Bacteroidia bacterium]|nr:NIPSNAP family containing protein [Bacteroidia bacterium]
MKTIFATLASILIVAAALAINVHADQKPMHQLRIYTLNADNQAQFHERFRDHAHRIMKKYDFHIVSIWESRHDGKVEFVYLLQWKDEQTMKACWERFMADEEWKEIKLKTSARYGSFVESIEEKTLTLVDYSPNTNLILK